MDKRACSGFKNKLKMCLSYKFSSYFSFNNPAIKQKINFKLEQNSSFLSLFLKPE